MPRTPGYRFIEGLTVADVAFEAFGKDEAQLLQNAGLATMAVNVTLKTVKPSRKETFSVEGATLDKLLFAFLDHIIYLKDAKSMLFSKFEVSVKKSAKLIASVTAWGEEIAPGTHELKTDVKAVTYHEFVVERLPDKTLRAQVVLDI